MAEKKPSCWLFIQIYPICSHALLTLGSLISCRPVLPWSYLTPLEVISGVQPPPPPPSRQFSSHSFFHLYSTRYNPLLHPSHSFNISFFIIKLRPLRHGHPHVCCKCAFQHFEGCPISNRNNCRGSGTGRHRKNQRRGEFAADITCVPPVLVPMNITHWPCCSRPWGQEQPTEESK